MCVICGAVGSWGRNKRLKVEVEVKQAGNASHKRACHQEIELCTLRITGLSIQSCLQCLLSLHHVSRPFLDTQLYEGGVCEGLTLDCISGDKRIAETWEEFCHYRWNGEIISLRKLSVSSAPSSQKIALTSYTDLITVRHCISFLGLAPQNIIN